MGLVVVVVVVRVCVVVVATATPFRLMICNNTGSIFLLKTIINSQAGCSEHRQAYDVCASIDTLQETCRINKMQD